MTATLAPQRVPSPRPVPRPGPRPSPRPEPRPVDRSKHLRVVGPTERARRRLTPKAGVALTAILFATLFAVAIAHTVLVQGQIRLDDLDAQLTTEQTRYQELRKDVAEMEAPERIVAAAHEQGMVTPDDLVYLQPLDAETDGGTGAPLATDAELARTADGAWSTVKPLLETSAP